MAKQSSAALAETDVEKPLADGRRERSRSSRAKIVAAMLELVADGDVSPSAARVAEAAGVGLRTVFRHFDDMDALYREMSDAIEAKLMPLISQSFESDDWRGQLVELAERRSKVFDIMMPYRISGNLKRFHSPYLMKDYKRVLRMDRDYVEAILPDVVKSDRLRTEGLVLTLGFNSWRRLRHDEGMSTADAKAVILQMLQDLLTRIEG